MRKVVIIVSAIVLTYSISAKAERLVCSETRHLRKLEEFLQVLSVGKPKQI